jgi:hypothetical protein
MVEQLPSNEPGANKRRSTRIVQAVPIVVTGTDALGQPFKERTSTLIINCHGFKYQSKHYVLKNSWLEVEIPQPEPGAQPRVVRGVVTFVQRPRTVRELFQLGVEFESPGNVWGIAFPPDDWFSVETAEPTAPAVPAPAAPAPKLVSPPPKAAPAAPPRPVIPDRIMAELPVSVARQISAMIADAQKQFQQSAQEAISSALASETQRLFGEINAQMRDAAAKAVESAAADYAERTFGRMTERIEEAQKAALQESKAAWSREIENGTQGVTQRFLAQLEATASGLRADWAQRIREDLENATRRLDEIEQRLSAAQSAADVTSRQTHENVSALREEMEALLSEARRTLISLHDAEVEKEKARLSELASEAAKLAERIRATADAALIGWQQEAEKMARSAVESAEQTIAAHATEISEQASAQVAAHAEKHLAEADARLQATSRSLDEHIARGEACAAHMDSTARRIEELSHGAVAEFNKRFNSMLVAQNEELNAQVEHLISTLEGRVTPVLESKGAEIKSRLESEIEQHLKPLLERARATVEELAARQARAAQAIEEEKVAMRAAADEVARGAIESMRAMAAQVEKGFGESVRGVMEQCLAELDEKSTEVTHTTFESLYKSSDWYQKKAQASMHSALEKVVTEAAGHLRDKAAELSGIFASELDHYSRSYVEHTHGLLAEAAQSMADRLREQFQEAMEAAAARMADEAHRIATDKVDSLKQESEAVVKRSSAWLSVHIDDLQKEMAEHAQRAAGEFDHRLQVQWREELIAASRQFQAQMAPLLDSWKSDFQAAQRDWLSAMEGHSDESLDKFRERLENVSNTWMLAAVSNLSQQAQQLLDSLVRSSEENLRRTCAQVLGEIGVRLGERLRTISDEMQPPPSGPENSGVKS